MRNLLSMVFKRFTVSKQNWVVLASLAIQMILCIFSVNAYVSYANAIECRIQAFEPYLIITSTSFRFFAAILGFFVLTANIPDETDRSAYEIIRTGKRSWLTEKMWFIIFLCVLYSSFMVLICIVLSSFKVKFDFQNKWSEAMKTLAERNPSFANLNFGLSFPYPLFVRKLTPYKALALSFFLETGYMILLGEISFCLNAFCKHRIGTISSIGIHIIGYIINMNGPLNVPQKYSFLSNSLLAYYYVDAYGLTLSITITIYIMIPLLVWFVLRYFSKYYQL